MRKLIVILVVFTVLPQMALAQPTVEQMAAQTIAEKNERQKTTYTITSENDLYGAGTDEGYTNGIRFSAFNAGYAPPKLWDAVDKFIPFFQANETTSVYYALGQNLYAPSDIRLKNPPLTDRPYAAFLYGSMGLLTVEENHIDEMEVTLGVVGPAALGGPVQSFVHEHISDSPKPEGWRHQLKNEPIVNLSYQRRWPAAVRADVGDDLRIAVMPHAGVTAGNAYTYANAGATVKLSPKSAKLNDIAQRVRPSIPGTGYFVEQDDVQWSVFAAVDERAVAHNIFLDGNTLAESRSVDKRNFVTDLTAGVQTSYGPMQVSYTAVYRTKEFENQDDNSLFGVISLGYKY